MKVSYKKLWILCAEKEITRTELRKTVGFSSATFTKLCKTREVNLSILPHIAEIMDSNARNMMDFIKESKSAAADMNE